MMTPLKDQSAYKVFIASSLTLREDRQDVEDAVLALNEGVLKDTGIQFSIFDYLKEETIVQKLEKGDAQEPIRRHLFESLVFILIIRGRIGNLSVSEFEDAAQRFLEGRLPEHVFIFYDEDHSRDSIHDEKGISFPQFEQSYLRKVQLDSAYRLIPHERGYYIPFGGKFPSLKEQVMKYLGQLVKSDEWHFPGSLRSIHLRKEDFYFDENRLRQCWKHIYFYRRFDAELDDALANKQIVFVEGASLSGKTRAVMQTLSSTDDGWICILPGYGTVDRENAVSGTIEAFLSYLNNHKGHPQHYVFLDDVHDLDSQEDEDNPGNRKLRKQLGLFLHAALQGAFKLIVTSTKPFSQTLGPFLNEDNDAVRRIFIPEMREDEYKDAVAFFSGYGLLPYNPSPGYRTTGAMLIDLDLIRGSYLDFLNQKETVSEVRHAFLKAIKAASIWKETNFGELGILKSLTRFFLEKDGLQDWNEILFDRSLKALIDKPQCGVTRLNKNRIVIQEYVYRELIGFDGNIKDKDNDDSAVEKEKALIRELMEYCLLHEKTVALTQQVGKLGSRSENRSQIGPWLLDVFTGKNPEGHAPWVNALTKERERYELAPLSEGDEYPYWYSKVFSNAILNASSFKDALEIYRDSASPLRAPNLLANLMRTAETAEDWEQIRLLEEYDRYVIREREPFVLSRLMELQKDFPTLLGYFHSVSEGFSYSPEQVADARLKQIACVPPDEAGRRILKDISIMEDSLDALGRAVHSEEDFSELMVQLRSYYYVKVTDPDVLEKMRRKTLDPRAHRDDLTLLDLLSVLETSAFRMAVQGAFGEVRPFKARKTKALRTAESFVKNRLLPSFGPTLKGRFTDESTARWTASSCVNALIESLIHLGFEQVRDTVFKAAQCPHPLRRGKQMILRDCYAYHYLLRADSCSPIQARGLLDDYLLPHTQDPDNPLVLSAILLNMVLENALKTSSSSFQDISSKIIPLFRQNHIRPDTRTYYLLIKNERNEAEAVEQVRQMVDAGISPDVYTLCALTQKMSDLKGALGLTSIPEGILPEGYEVREALPEGIQSHPAIRLLRDSLSTTKEWWAEVFMKECKSETDRDVLDSALKYIKENRPEFLDDSRVFNAIVRNASFLKTIPAVFEFIRDNAGDAFPDSYTLTILTFRISRLKGLNKWNSLKSYNWLTVNLFQNNRLEWSSLATRRMRLFSSFNEVLGLIFKDVDENGDVFFHTERVPLIGYLKRISAEEIPDLPIMYANLRKVPGFREEEQHVCEIFPDVESYDWNKSVTDRYMNGEYGHGIWDAVRSLKWTDYSSAVFSFNRMLYRWSRDQAGTPQRFEYAWQMYQTFFKQGSPMAETYSVLVNCCSTYGDVINYIYPAYDTAKRNYPQLFLDGVFLSRTFRFGHCAADLRAYAEVFLQKGGVISNEAVGSAMIHMLGYRDQGSSEVLTAVSRNLFGDNWSPLKKFGPPMSKLNPNSIDGRMLYAAFVHSCRNHLYTRQQIEDCLISRYRDILLEPHYGFLPLVLKYDEGRSNYFIMLVLRRLLEEGVVSEVPSDILQAATLALRSFQEYRLFIQALKKGSCLNIDDMVPSVIRLLYAQERGHGWIRRPELEGCEEARGVYSRVVTYCGINRLRNGHLLPNQDENDPDDRWCQRSMDCARLKRMINPLLGNRTIIEQIRYAVQNLPDRYLSALRSIIYEKHERFPKDDDWVVRKIKEFEDDYAKQIDRGQIPFEEMTSLASLWLISSVNPGARILIALFRAYRCMAENAEDDTVREEAAVYYKSMYRSIQKAGINKRDSIRFFYSNLGKLSEQETQKNYYVVHTIAEFEEEYAYQIEHGQIPFEEIASLASLWINIHIVPGARMIVALYKAYCSLAKYAEDDTVRKEAAGYRNSMYHTFQKAGRNHFLKVKFYYSNLGRLNEKERQRDLYVLIDSTEFSNLWAPKGGDPQTGS